jgi:dynein heavy chain 2
VFIASELALAAALMADVKSVMEHAGRVVDGTELPSTELRVVARELATFTTPDKWQDRMAGPENLAAWMTLLQFRAGRLAAWHAKYLAQPHGAQLLAEPLDLNDLLRPQTFLNALRQHTARRTGAELVKLVLNSTTGGAALSTTSQTVVATLAASSLRVQGAVAGGDGRLSAASKDTGSTSPFVALRLAWVPRHEVPSSSGTVSIPLYAGASRENLIADVSVPCDAGTADDWVLRGVALILAPPTTMGNEL